VQEPIKTLPIRSRLWRASKIRCLPCKLQTTLAINDSGQVVGEAQIAGNTAYHAFIYSRGKMYNLGILPGSSSTLPFAINNLGQIVGNAQIPGNNIATHAFLYSGGKIYDLNNLLVRGSGWMLASATGINDRGEIVGYGFGPLPNGPHAFLLTPVEP
jgi:probable HAF family extracellular repeat protein